MKAVLVIDMPPTCWDCPVCSEGYCMADVSIENKDFETSRDARCPLKEMPKKRGKMFLTERSQNDTDLMVESAFAYCYTDGWNACIEELEK